jgi:hypothetical protein
VAFAGVPDSPGSNPGQRDDQAPSPVEIPKDAEPAPAPAKLRGWQFSLFADAYTTANRNNPSDDYNQLQNFDLHQGAPRLSLAKFTIDKSDQTLGLHLDVGTGETLRLIHSYDSAAETHKAFRYFEQMYVIVKPKHLFNTEIDFGQFTTSAGAESVESISNFNYSRSLLFAWSVPYFHFGLRTSTPISKDGATTISFQLLNSWNSIWGNNNFRIAGVALTRAKDKKPGYNIAFYRGRSDFGSVGEVLAASYFTCRGCKFEMYVDASWGRNNDLRGGYEKWYGFAVAARRQLGGRFAIAARAEILNDPDGFQTGQPQILKEGTLTAEARLGGHLVTRLEFRHDSSDHNFFNHGNAPPVNGQSTLTLGIMTQWGWK